MGTSSNLTAPQETAILTAMKKAIEDRLEGRRAEADADIRKLYEQTGADRLKVRIGDTEVGTLSIAFSKDAFEVTDEEVYHDFLIANGLADVKDYIKPEYMPLAVSLLKEADPNGIEEKVLVHKDAEKFVKPIGEVCVIDGTNEVVPGVRPKAAEIKGTRLTGCKPESVVPALNAIPGGVTALLMGGAE